MITAAELQQGQIEIEGQIPWASNHTFVARLGDGRVVYKPRRGERPLWDFPQGTLCQREVAAFEVSRSAGWDLVPVTVLRDGPLGVGSVQAFVEHDPAVTAVDLIRDHRPELRSVALFDLVCNNADRKAGHVIRGDDGKIWALDHGICFHAEPKLRTVLWDFVGEGFDEGDILRLERLATELAGRLCDRLDDLLSAEEIEALRDRTVGLLNQPVFPEPPAGRSVPWPPV